jgi:hypothetical protein
MTDDLEAFRAKLNERKALDETDTRRLMRFVEDAMDDIEAFVQDGGRLQAVCDAIRETLGIECTPRQLSVIKYRCKLKQRKRSKTS